MKRMAKRTVAAAALVWVGFAGSAGAQTPTTVDIDPGTYVLPTQLERQPPTQVEGVQVARPNLARTGSDAMPMVAAGGGLAAAGAVFVIAARRRRSSAA